MTAAETTMTKTSGLSRSGAGEPSVGASIRARGLTKVFGSGTGAFHALGPIDVDRRMVVVKIQNDGQCHGGFGGGQHDHEQGDQLPVESDADHSRP